MTVLDKNRKINYSFDVIETLMGIIQDLASVHEITLMGVLAGHNPKSIYDGKLFRAFSYDMNLHSISRLQSIMFYRVVHIIWILMNLELNIAVVSSKTPSRHLRDI